MTREEEHSIQFYRTEAVHTILKRYDFTNEEKQVITAAILTAKKEKPNMLLIKKADQLLQDITATQKTAHDSKVDKTEIAKGQARAAVVDSHMKRVRAEGGGSGWNIEYVAITVAIASTIFYIYTYFAYPGDDTQKRQKLLVDTYAEAKAYCQKQGKVLPLTIEDAPNHLQYPNEYNAQGYWRADGGVIYNIAHGYTSQPDGKKHYVVCVDTNGKDIVRY
jgi:hypothetical protein